VPEIGIGGKLEGSFDLEEPGAEFIECIKAMKDS
jgi:hypothetical protein